MKKQWIALLLAAALLVGLTACAPKEEPAPAEPETPPAPAEPQKPEEPEQPEEPAPQPEEPPQKPAGPLQMLTVEYLDETYTNDKGEELLVVSLAHPVLTGGDPAVIDRVNGVLDTLYNNRLADAEDYRTMAAEDQAVFQEDGMEFWPYGIQSRAYVSRLDGKVLSLVISNSDFTGGAHPFGQIYTVNFDLTTGEQLSMGTAAVNPEGMLDKLAQAIRDRISEEPEMFYPDAQDMAAAVVNDDGWRFTDEGVGLIVNAYELAPYAAGPQTFLLPYEQLDGLLDPRWLPEQTEASGQPEADFDENIGGQAVQKLILEPDSEDLAFGCSEILTDVAVHRVSSYDGVNYHIDRELLRLSRLAPGEAIVVQTYIPDTMPNVAVSCRQADGSRTYYGLCQSGEDGSIFLMELGNISF